MKKEEKNVNCENCPYKEQENCEKTKEKVDVETKIYNALNVAEKIAVKLAQMNQVRKKNAKKKKKKVKKLGKVDKKTGTLILKGQKKEKKAKTMGRYKPKKK